MNIMELGAIGELVGGTAVLVTLIYLALQGRQGNQVEKGETHRAFVSDWNNQVNKPFTDPEVFNATERWMTAFLSTAGGAAWWRRANLSPVWPLPWKLAA